jgi:hypothetical protein
MSERRDDGIKMLTSVTGKAILLIVGILIFVEAFSLKNVTLNK